MQNAINLILDVLYPPEDPHEQWDSETIERVVGALRTFRPYRLEIDRRLEGLGAAPVHQCDDEACPGWFVNVGTLRVERCDTCKVFASDDEALTSIHPTVLRWVIRGLDAPSGAAEMALWDQGYEAASHYHTKHPNVRCVDSVVTFAIERGTLKATDCASVCKRCKVFADGAAAFIANLPPDPVSEAYAAFEPVTLRIESARLLDVCTSDYFQGYSAANGEVLAVAVDGDTTWGELRAALVDEHNAVGDFDTIEGAEDAIRAMFDGVDDDEPNDFGLEPRPDDEDDEGESVYVYVALAFDDESRARKAERDAAHARRLDALRP